MIAEKFQQEFANDLRQQLLPMDYVTEFWKDSAIHALDSVSAPQLGISVEDFEALVIKLREDGHCKLSLMEFAICNNLLENQSRKSLDINHKAYFRLQHEVIKLAQDWTARTKVIRVNVQQRINAEEKAKAVVAGNGKMKAVTADA